MAFDQYQEENISQINITPLVDVMLVLLVIFMVTVPILQQGVNVELPQVTAGPLEGKDDQLVVLVTREGKVQLGETAVDLESLQERLRPLLEEQPDRQIFLRADKGVPYGRVVEVMASVRNAGVKKIGMVTEPGQDE